MATGSGKTLIMAGIILYLYDKGYRNFLFFVNSDNVIEKTKDNFSIRHRRNIFSARLSYWQQTCGGKKSVENFQDSDPDAINFLFTNDTRSSQ